MSQTGSQPTTAGPATALPSSSQPLVPPPRTSSRAPSLNGDGGDGKVADGKEDIGLGAPAQSGVPSTEKAESIGRSSKRSITGRRKRDASAASKRSGQGQTASAEKTAMPSTAGQTGTSGQPRPKKKGGFLSFLNCCSAPDESQEAGQGEGAQPAKPPKTQPVRAQQPMQQRQPQNVSTTATSTEDSKEVIDEKANQPPYQAAPAAEPILPIPEPERPPQGDAPAEKPASDMASNAPPTHPDPVVHPLEADKQPEAAATGPPQIDTAASSREVPASAASPQLQVQAPTPVVQQQSDEAILDRTPVQAERDNDIEMSDAGPSVPLSESDAQHVLEEEKHDQDRRESEGMKRESMVLPPPPPIPNRQESHDGAQVSHETSKVSTPEQAQRWLLPPITSELRGRKCLVLDLDETLVHSSFKILHQADFTIPVEIEGQYHNVYVIKRPGVDQFLKRVGELYEIVVFTASVAKYGDPLLDILDIHHVVHHRLFRESCYNHQGNYVKDLSQVGRPLHETIIIDNSPTSYIFHPQHAVPVSSWFSDAHDNELLDLIPVLEDLAGPQVSDVSLVLDVAL